MYRGLFVLALVFTGVPACSRLSVDTAAEQKKVEALAAGFNDLIRAKNDSAITALYAADAILLPPNMPVISGAGAIRTFWATLWPMNAVLTITPTTVTVAQAGDLAIDEGTWTFEQPAQPGAPKDNGKYLVVWRKGKNGWKVSHDMWSSNNPPPPGPPPSN